MTIYLIERFVIDRWMPLKMQETCFSKTRAIKCITEILESAAQAAIESHMPAVIPPHRIAEYQSTGRGLRLRVEEPPPPES
jgi:hypothetical protein